MSSTSVLEVVEGSSGDAVVGVFAKGPECRSPVERQLSQLWRKVLGVDGFSRDGNFLDLGGNSSLALELVAHIRVRFEINLPVLAVFDFPEFARMSLEIDRRLQERAIRALDGTPSGPTLGSLRPVVPAFHNGAAGVSPTQRNIWQRHQSGADPRQLNLMAVTPMGETIRADILNLCLHDLLRRHEILRSRFAVQHDRLVQVLDAAASADLTRVTCESVSQVHIAVAHCQAFPFDLRCPPLIRATLLRRGSHDVLVLVAHAIVVDAVSLGTIQREVTEQYQLVSSTRRMPFSRPLLQYADYSAWQQSWFRSADYASQVRFWKERLEGAFDAFPFPTVASSKCAGVSNRATHRLVCGNPLVNALERIGRTNSATLFMVSLAALKAVVYRQTGRGELVVSSNVSVRCRPELANMVGPFTNRVLLRSSLHGSQTFSRLLQSVRTTWLNALDSAELPFDEVVRTSGVALHHDVQISVVYADCRERSTDCDGMGPGSVVCLPVEDIMVQLIRTGSGLEVCIDCDADLFEFERVSRLARDLGGLLSYVGNNPTTAIRAFPLASGEAVIDSGIGPNSEVVRDRPARPYAGPPCGPSYAM